MWITDRTMEMNQSDIRRLLFERYGYAPEEPGKPRKINRPPTIMRIQRAINLKTKKNGK